MSQRHQRDRCHGRAVPKINQAALADLPYKTNPRDASAADYEMMLKESL